MKLTHAQRHAILLLEIQDAKRGWARQGTLRHCGVSPRTLAALHRRDQPWLHPLVELDVPPDTTDSYHWRWRLTGAGEREAARLKALGLTVTKSDTETVTGSVQP